MPSQIPERPIFYNLSDICPISDAKNRSFDGLKLLESKHPTSGGGLVDTYLSAPKKHLLVHTLIATDGVPADAQLHSNLHLTDGLSG